MLIQEKFAVAAIVLAALVYLIRVTAANYRARRSENGCSGCGCGKALKLTNPNGKWEASHSRHDPPAR